MVNSVRLNNISFLNGCFYINANDTQTYLTMNLVLVVINYKKKVELNKYIDLPVFTYTNNGHSSSLND